MALAYLQEKSLHISKDYEGILWLTETIQDSSELYRTIMSE